MTTYVWPFAPLSEVVETASWLTDVLRTRSSEQRQNLRAVPRRELSYTHNLSDADVALAREYMRAADDWYVPDWTRMVHALAVSGGPVALPDGPAVIWRSPRDFEPVTATGGYLGPVLGAYGMVRIIPAYRARMVDGWTSARKAGGWSQGSVTFEIAEGVLEEGALYPQYQGHDFLNSPQIIGNSTFSEGLNWQQDVIDNQVAAPVGIRTLTYADVPFMVRWWSRDIAAVRAWVNSRRGRWRSFWLPSWAHDMRKLSGSGASLTVDQYDAAEGHIAALIGGILYPRGIQHASRNSSGTWSITLDSALPAGDVARLMYLRHARFDSDRVEFQHKAAAGVSVAVPCIEVPA